MDNYLKELFIDEAKPALDRHSGSGSGSDSDDQTYILVDENGTEVTAVLVDEETVFDATANDIREGKVAATESGVTVGTKEIPSYVTEEGYILIPSGNVYSLPFENDRYDFTKLQAIICQWAGSITGSVASDKVVIDENVYPVNSTESIAVVTKDSENQSINLGISNDSESLYLVRYFTYKEVA